MVERFHRTLKSAIKCHKNENWTNSIPTILFGLRSTIKEDIGFSSAELVYGSPIRLPAEIFNTTNSVKSHADFIKNLQENFKNIKAVPGTNHSNYKTFVFKELDTCTHVFVKVDGVKAPLQAPYSAPHEIIRKF